MAREQRKRYVSSFARETAFDEEIYQALRQSPWWMISIAVHVLLVVVSTMLSSGNGPVAATPPPVTAAMAQTDDAVEPPPDDAPQIEQYHDSDVEVREPAIRDVEIADHAEDDTDQPTEDVGGGGGAFEGPIAGPGNNSTIGLGGGGGGGRRGLGGHRRLRPSSGHAASEAALEDALRWLKAHQSPDGGWEAAGFGRWLDGKPAPGAGPDGAGKAAYDVGVTGLSLLAFLGAGYTHRSDDPDGFGKVVSNGLKWLKSQQDAEGCFGPRASGHYVYNHAIATLAMVEAYAMTGASIFRSPTQRALDFVTITRNPYFAWRYGVKPGDNDTSVTGWMMMALKSAKMSNESDVAAGRAASLVIDEDAFDGVRTWIDKMTDPDTGRVGYQQRGSGPARPTELVDRFPSERSESMTAVGVLARIFLRENPKTSDLVKKGAALCTKPEMLPRWDTSDGSIDMYYWYYATLAMFQVGGEPWSRWNKAMQTAVVDTQRKDGDYGLYKGSWDPVDPWGADGGRVYSTACLAMCLEVYYRYPKVFTGGDR
jgi:hypothetical protein